MTQDRAIQLMNAMLIETMWVAGPVLAAILIVGLLISILQATTQLQEMTLRYVPKMLVAGLVLIFLGPWMIGRMMQFALYAIGMIPGLS